MKRRCPFPLSPFSHRQIPPPATPMTPPTSVSYFAADYPPINPSLSQFCDDPFNLSENLFRFCAKTIAEADVHVAATNSLISSIYEALDAPLFGESKVCEFDSHFSENLAGDSIGLEPIVPETAFDDSIVPETVFDDSIVPETAFDDPMDLEDEGFWEARGGDLVHARAEAASVTAEEAAAPADSPPKSPFDEMIAILLPAYLKLVRSFPYLVCLTVIRFTLGLFCDSVERLWYWVCFAIHLGSALLDWRGYGIGSVLRFCGNRFGLI